MQWVKPEVVRPQWVRVKGGGGVPERTAPVILLESGGRLLLTDGGAIKLEK